MPTEPERSDAASAPTAAATPSAAAPATPATPAARALVSGLVPAAYRGLPATVWTLFAGTVVNRFGYVVTPFLVFFLADRGITGTQVPWVLGALGAGNLLGPALGGFLADRIGRRPTMLFGLVGASLAQGALFFAPGLATLAAAALLLSTTGATVSPAAYALMADAVAPVARRRAYALFGWGVNIGTAAAGIVGGLLAAHGYWLLFAVDAASMLGYAAIVVARLPAPPPAAGRAPAKSGGGGGGGGYGIVLRDRLALLLLPLLGVHLFVYSLTEAALPIAVDDAGLGPAVYGALAAVNAVLVVLLQPLTTHWLADVDRVRVQAVAGVLIAAGVALTGLADNVFLFVVSVFVWSVGEVLAAGINAALVADLAPAEARGRYQGAFQWFWGLARFLSLTLGVTLYTAAGPAVLWWTALATGLLGSAGVLALRPALARRAAHDLAA
ncbi:MFS transporter [Streptomyces sp. NPDC007088]|uniref:MFS transporter n=1 Tax=Streptomyces sp. NPDC007088 TaxID=3364773 RepID=UPI00369E26CE